MTDPAASPSSSVQATYDTIARAYDAQFAAELDAKPLDRGLLAAFLDLAGDGTVADIGCGPGQVTRFLAARHPDVTGIDLSPGMIAAARERAPELEFTVGSMLRLPVADSVWAGAIALYSIIHLTAAERPTACKEFARAIRSGGWLLIAFHIDSADFASGEVNHITTWFGEPVQIDGYFLDPAVVTSDLEAAGFTVMSTTIRQPWPGVEYPSRRCYLLAQRTG